MTNEQAERLLHLARKAVEVAGQHRLQLLAAPKEVKENISALQGLIEEIDRGA